MNCEGTVQYQDAGAAAGCTTRWEKAVEEKEEVVLFAVSCLYYLFSDP